MWDGVLENKSRTIGFQNKKNITLDSSSFFLTQYGEKGGEEDDDDVRSMREHKEQQEKKEGEGNKSSKH